MPSRLTISPVFAISNILIFPEPKTIALGGVATGNMKAKEADIVIGSISKRGLT